MNNSSVMQNINVNINLSESQFNKFLTILNENGHKDKKEIKKTIKVVSFELSSIKIEFYYLDSDEVNYLIIPKEKFDEILKG